PNSGSIEVLDNGLMVLSPTPLNTITMGLIINGLQDNNSLTIDFSSGDPIPADGTGFTGLTFNGGTATTPFNSLVLQGGSETAESFSPGATAGSGNIRITVGGISNTASFTELRPFFSNAVQSVTDVVPGPLVVNGATSGSSLDYLKGDQSGATSPPINRAT